MSTFPFYIKEHVIPCQHIRGYPRATAHQQEEILHLSVKQYTPHDNPNPKVGDVTIIGAHAQGFPKELYEPLWEELYHRTKDSEFAIRSIWIADVANQGASGVINEYKLGNDPCAFDHARDLLHMVNTFRDQMIRPIVGIGHSMGGTNLVNLALIHPRLLDTLILIDPIIHRRIFADGYQKPASASARRRDVWPSRAAAAKYFRKNKFYQSWDPRVLDLWIQYGLRDLPTAIYPHRVPDRAPDSAHLNSELASTASPEKPNGVTLTTTKDQEVFTFLRPSFNVFSEPELEPSPWNEYSHPDYTPDAFVPNTLFYRAETVITFQMLPFLRPSVLYVFGGRSHYSAAEPTTDKTNITGIGAGGSGGVAEGRVAEVTIDGAGHLIPMEEVGKTADLSADWLSKEMRLWRAKETAERSEWASVPDEQKRVLSARFLDMLDGRLETSDARISKL